MTTKTELLKIVRAKCLDCCVGQVSEVALCAVVKCALHEFRMGKDPAPNAAKSLAAKRRGFGLRAAE